MKISKKALSLILVISMVFSVIPNSFVYAAGESAKENTYQDSANASKSDLDSGFVDSGVLVTGIKLNKSSLTLENGESETLIATVTPENASNPDVCWTTSNNNICKVDQNGKVTAKANGTAVITAITYDGTYTVQCKVTVITSVTGIELDKTNITLAKGEKETLTAVITPKNASEKGVLWSSSDTAVCTVDSFGNISALNVGTAVITATTKDGGFTAKCTVTVIIPSSSITLNKTNLTLEKGKSETLKATVLPENASDKSVTWSSSDEQICTVDETGKVTAVKDGTAVITATTADGKYTADCNVTVSTPVTGVTLNKSSLTLAPNDMEALVATVSPEDATDKTVTWSSSDEQICTVDETGKVTAIKSGTAVITAAVAGGKFTASCTVKVSTPVTGVTLNKSSLSLTPNASESLVATVFPEDATNKSVVWSSSDEQVCTVDQSGKVTAVKDGTAVITVTTADGEFTVKCSVTVFTAVTGVTLNKTNATLSKSTTEKLTASIKPEDASQKDVSWSSSDENVCTVDSSGNITALNAGTAVVTVTTKDGGFTAQCSVTVIIPATGIQLSSSSLTLTVGKSDTLTATVLPEVATDKTVTWSSSDDDVAMVTKSGKVIALGVGTAVITAATKDGISAQCSVTVTNPAVSIKLSSYELTLIPGKIQVLTATVYPEDATDKTVTWSSSNENVAYVTQSGKIIALGTGTATITVVTKNGVSAQCLVTVTNPAESIKLSSTALTLTVGKSETLSATVLPEDATDKTVVWSSSDENVAIVNQSGKVIAFGAGTATITATAKSGVSAQCSVTVINATVSVKLSSSALTLAVGKSDTLTAAVYPEDATDKTVTWSSSDENVVIVNQSGKVVALSVGTATITATTKSGASAQCSVTVTNPAASIKLSATTLTLTVGKSELLTATVLPEDATDKTVVWSSSDENIVMVSQSGKVVALGVGNASITATAKNGVSAQCSVTVAVPVESIKLSAYELTLSEGQSKALTATVSPEDATDKTVAWSSSDENVAMVTKSGKVVAVGVGTAVITASTKNGISAQCSVTVVIPVTGITISSSALTLIKGSSEALTAVITPNNATDKTVCWSSSDENVAAVDQFGKVTAVSNGTTVITVKTRDGDFTTECNVTVITSVTGVSLNKTETTLVKGTNETLTATVTPDSASQKAVIWSSSDESVCTVDASGKISALNEGKAIITIKTKNGGFTAQCAVTIVIPVTGITVSSSALTLIKGTGAVLTATVSPADATDKTVFWSSSDTNIATVDQSGKVTAVNVGTATITATTKDGGFTAKTLITVNPNTYKITANAVHGSVTGVGAYNAGSTVTLTAVPEEHYHFVNWTDSNGNVIGTNPTYIVNNLTADTTVTANFAIDMFTVTVNAGEGGTVTGNVSGTYAYGTIIQISAIPDDGYLFSNWSDGSNSAVLSFKVTGGLNLAAYFVEKPSTVELSKSQCKILIGSHYQFSVKLKSNSSAVTATSWKSSNSSVLQVDQNGTVSAMSLGTAKITATYSDGSVAKCTVQVVDTVNFTYAKYAVISYAGSTMEDSYYNSAVTYGDNYFTANAMYTTRIRHRTENGKSYYDYNDKDMYSGYVKLYMDTLVSVNSLNFALSGCTAGTDKKYSYPASSLKILDSVSGRTASQSIAHNEEGSVISQNYSYSDIGAVDTIMLIASAGTKDNLKISDTVTGYDSVTMTLSSSSIIGVGGHYISLPNQPISVFETPYCWDWND